MSKKPITLRKHSADRLEGDRYFPLDSEVWRRDPDRSEHLAIVIHPIRGELGPKTQRLARICAKALNESDDEKE
jgi:hypothetical protein